VIYLLDTNVVIAVLTRRVPGVRERLRAALANEETIGISSIVAFELSYGAANSQRRSTNAEALRVFLASGVTHLPFDAEDAAVAGRVRADLCAAGTPLGPYDLLLAAQALRGGFTLVTGNASAFGRVGGLVWEDWADG
jgi:tRNA(fMet)-specific endonuclease VapC